MREHKKKPHIISFDFIKHSLKNHQNQEKKTKKAIMLCILSSTHLHLTKRKIKIWTLSPPKKLKIINLYI